MEILAYIHIYVNYLVVVIALEFSKEKVCRHPGLDPGSPKLSQSLGIAGQARNDVACMISLS